MENENPNKAQEFFKKWKQSNRNNKSPEETKRDYEKYYKDSATEHKHSS